MLTPSYVITQSEALCSGVEEGGIVQDVPGRAIKIGKRRLLADASPGPGSLPQRPQKNRASVGHPSPALTYSKPARMASLQGG